MRSHSGLCSSLVRIALLFLLSSCLFFDSGCVGVTRMPTRSRGPQGASIRNNQVDLSFLQVGSTRREEVANKLGSIDTAYSNPRLFWGRWTVSRWGCWWFVTGQTVAAGDAKRLWRVHDLVLTFDENGIMQTSEVFDDDRALWRALHAKLANAGQLDLSTPITLSLTTDDPARFTLTERGIHVERQKAKDSFDISPKKVTRFSHNRYGASQQGFAPGSTCHTLRFAEKIGSRKSIDFCADPAEVATLFQYLRENGPAKMVWK